MTLSAPDTVNRELVAAVDALTRRLADWSEAPPHVDVANGWHHIGAELGLAHTTGEGPSLGIGPISCALGLAPRAAHLGVLGFIAPAAYTRRRWLRRSTDFLDPTRAVWDAGWSPLAIARVTVDHADGAVQIVVGHARPTPAQLKGRSWQAT